MQNKYACKNIRMVISSMKEKNEHINLWIIDSLRKESRAKSQEQKVSENSERHRCPNCKKGFSEPKIVQYYVCPHCESKFEQDLQRKGNCTHWLGFLTQKDKNGEIPQECVECPLVLECMLNTQASKQAVSEIKKWF